MTALNFPDSPSNGDTYQGYTYNGTKGTWAKPAEQDARTAVYANIAALPTSGTAGDMAYVTATNRLYIWTGTGWYNIALINNNPTISGVSATYDLAIDGTATTVTMTATDPEGLPITYSIASDTSGNIATVAQGTGANTNVFTITPSTNTAHAGTFSLTFRASDGVNIASAAASFTLEFKVTNSRYTTALITSVGANNATNASFDDKSTSNHTITASGDVHQTTFSPYRQGGHAQHFTNDRISYANHSSMQIGTQDFCMEAWIKLRTQGVNYERYITHQASWAQGGVKGVEFASQTTGNLKLHLMIDGSSATDFGYEHSIVKERWYHAVITRESGHARIFIDGVMKNNAANTTNINGANGTHFGTNTAGTDQMDDFLIRDFRLCIGGVPTDYSTTSTTNDATIFSVPDAHITKTSQGATASEVKALLFNTPYLKDNSDNTNASLTFHSLGKLVADSPYDTVKYAAATNGASATFDGNGDGLTITTNDFQFSGEFTFEGWVYWNGNVPSDWPMIFDGRPSNSSNANALAMNIHLTSHRLNFYIGSTNYYWGSTALPSNQWVHVAVVRDSNNDIKIYQDGVQGSGTVNSSATLSSISALRIGYNVANIGWWPGNITQFRVSDTARYTSTFTPPTTPFTSDSNTKFLMEGTDAGIIDKSQSCQSITLAGNTKSSTAQTKYLSSSIYVDGTGDYILLDDTFDLHDMFASDFTIEGWYYPSTTPASSVTAVFSKRANGSVTGGVLLYFAGADTTPSLLVDTGGSWGINSACSSGFTVGQWNHFAVTRNGSAFKVFIDGSSVLSVSSSATIPNNTAKFGIGTMGNDGSYAMPAAYFSDVRITKGLARYTSNFTAPTAALQG